MLLAGVAELVQIDQGPIAAYLTISVRILCSLISVFEYSLTFGCAAVFLLSFDSFRLFIGFAGYRHCFQAHVIASSLLAMDA